MHKKEPEVKFPVTDQEFQIIRIFSGDGEPGDESVQVETFDLNEAYALRDALQTKSRLNGFSLKQQRFAVRPSRPNLPTPVCARCGSADATRYFDDRRHFYCRRDNEQGASDGVAVA